MNALALLTVPMLALLPSSTSAPTASQDAPDGREALPEAHEVLGRYRAALGPAERLDALASLRVRGTASWVGLEGEGTYTSLHAGLKRNLVVIEFDNFGRFEVGTDGALVWEDSPLETKIRDGWDASEFVRRFGVAQHAPWRSMFASARTVGLEPLDGVDHWHVELRPLPLAERADLGDEPPADDWYLDAGTGLLRKVVARGVGLDGSATEVVYVLDDWRAVDGVLYPFRKELKVSGFTLRTVATSVEPNPALPEEAFARSERVRDAVADHRSGETARRQEAVTLQTLEERHIASIRVTCKHAEMQKTLSQLLPEVFLHASSSGAAMTGPPMVVYHTWGDDLDLEAAVPVAAPVEPKGRVQAGTLPAGQAVVAWHVGPYERLGETHTRIQEYLDEHGLTQRAAAWEEYWTDPGMEPDPAKWRTKVVWPVEPAGDE